MNQKSKFVTDFLGDPGEVSPTPNHDAYFAGYIEAGEILLAQLLGGGKDNLLFPYLLTIRHCLELRLKELLKIAWYCESGSFDLTEEQKKFLQSHELLSLWHGLRKTFTTGPDAYLKSADHFFNEWAKMDPDSQVVRYPKTLKGENSFSSFDAFKPREIHKSFQATLDILNSLDGELDRWKEFVNDQIAEMRQANE